MSQPSILITGATGTVGSEVVKALREQGHKPKVLVRNPAKAVSYNGALEILEADLLQPTTLDHAFKSIERAFIMAPPTPEMEQMEANAFNAALRAGVKHIVYLSNFGAGVFGPPVWDWHGNSERKLRALGIPSTILRPARFMTDTPFPFSWIGIKEYGTLSEATGEGKISMIDPRDIGAVAAKILTSGGHEGQTYELTSNDLLSGSEIAAKISAELGKKVGFIDSTPGDSRSLMTRIGIPDFVVETILRYCETVREGRWHTTNSVAEILGKPPRDFDAWLRDKAATFSGG